MYIMDLENCQEKYAAALDFIKAIEDGKNGTIAERQHKLLEAAELISVSVALVKSNCSPRYFEEPMSMPARGGVSVESIQNKHEFTERDTYIVRRTPEKVKFHIRVHLAGHGHLDKPEEKDIIHLQYLAMLLKRASQFWGVDKKETDIEQKNTWEDELKKHLTVFIVPLTSSEYPFKNQNGQIDYSTYRYVSQHLRLLSKRYTGVIYGVDTDNNSPSVTSLEFRKNRKYTTCFPLIIIGQNQYNKLFVSAIDNILDDLFSLKKNGRFRNSRNENPNEAMADFIAEADLYHIRDVLTAENLKIVFQFLKERDSITLLEFSLFAFMLSEKMNKYEPSFFKNDCMNIWHFAHEISQGLRQIAQNAIQHTEGRECFLSFCFHERGKEEINTFISRISQSYPDTLFDSSAGEGALEILVSDLNEKEDIIDNFVSNLKYEREAYINNEQKKVLPAHLKLINCKEKIAVRNFFSEYDPEDIKEAWRDFRCDDLIAHIGLSQFAQVAKKCRASVKVLSNKSSKLIDNKKFFYCAYNDLRRQEKLQSAPYFEGGYVIPGMQFSILIPLHDWNENLFRGIGQLRHHNYVAEDYVSFAKFLDYEEERVDITLKTRRERTHFTELLDAKKKYRAVQTWREYWEKKFGDCKSLIASESIRAKKLVFNYDFSKTVTSAYFDDRDRIEVCLKGLISALDYVKEEKDDYLIALTNLPTGFIEIFRRICVQLSVRRFPENLQLCLYEKDEYNEKKVVFLGDDFSQAIYNSYILSMEHGIAGFDKKDCEKASELKETLIPDIETHETSRQQNMMAACPFDVILKCSSEDDRSFFERQLKNMAEGSLDEEAIGYKLNNTHMCLGSKVHIESFYEMSFLFYRTTIANRLAYKILKHIQKRASLENLAEKRINLLEDNILFYGYASYSKAILTSISEMLREYRVMKSENDRNVEKHLENRVAFASFQHNLMLESEETQMYYDLPLKGFPGIVDKENHLDLQEKVKVIQIVPISSTLTTFDKMWKKFSGSVCDKCQSKVCLGENYTVFWVTDQRGDLQNGKPSEIEKNYWKEVRSGYEVETNLPELKNAGNNYIQYFIRSSVVWHDPLACDLCYPDYVINEVPLVETDPTSTVPTQQIRYKGEPVRDFNVQSEEDYEKFKELMYCVSYDHICRRQNHYQFYIDTQRYFYNVRTKVKEWLQSYGQNALQETREPILNIIFSPEHNTNVGFVQYVNTYYFNGLAEIVSINVDKQFRSNFICEHAALKKIIEQLHCDRKDMSSLPVKFYFADDTVITGDTLEKANGLLHSLVPSDEYPVNLFSKIFVLIDRLSDTTKQMYIDDPNENFLSFLHMDISNTRTHGDSCIGCKLEQNAKKMNKRSATKSMALHWAQKTEDYIKKPYDNREKIAKIDKEKSYRMLMFSHILQNVIVKQGRCYDLGSAYDVMLNMSLWLLQDCKHGEECAYGYSKFFSGFRNMKGIKALMKTMCRPYFSYDFKIKRQVYTFFIYLTELIVGVKSEEILPGELEKNPHISFLTKNDRIAKTEMLAEKIKQNIIETRESELSFLQNYILEGLVDMNSTYVMRLQTLRKFYAYLRSKEKTISEQEKVAFWNSYGIFLHRLINGNADESRELWLEYLYMTGMEYRQFKNNYALNNRFDYEPQFLYRSVTEKEFDESKDRYFYQFCHNLFLQNTGINFDGLEEQVTNRSKTKPINGEYLKSCWEQMRRLDTFQNPLHREEEQKILNTIHEEELFTLLKSETNDMTEESVNLWYGKLLENIIEMIIEKYKIKKTDINIAMLTESKETKDDRKNLGHIQMLDIVRKKINFDRIAISETCYYIKERVMNALESKEMFDLDNYGYTICMDARVGEYTRPYVIALFDNPKKREEDSYERRLTRVFFYISIGDFSEKNRTQFVLRLILRDVMMYRNRILRFLKKDFASEIYASYAHKVGEKNILSHEKAHSHNTTADDKISLEIFQKIKMFGDDSEYKVLNKAQAAEWLLLRNYTNGQIAKIFNRGFHDEHGEDDILHLNIPMLYIPKDSKITDNLFKQQLIRFSDLNLSIGDLQKQDERFELLRKVIDIKYESKLNDALFIQGKGGQYYNLEYFKCILIDILLSAIKYESDRPDYLLRIDNFLDLKRVLEENEAKCNMQDVETRDYVERMKLSGCSVQIYREESSNPEVDYLIIRNRVDKLVHRLHNWGKKNEIIMHRLKDPLDYADGHMSLLAIKRYIENLDLPKELQCVFCYTPPKVELGEKGKLYFESRLPVLKKEDSK